MEADDQLLQILKGTAKEEDSHGFCFTIAGIFFYIVSLLETDWLCPSITIKIPF